MSFSGPVSSPNVRVRPATEADYGALVRLLEAAALPIAGLAPGLDHFYVAEGHGQVMGGVGLEPYGATALLRSAVVEPTYRGTGIGEMLVNRLLEHAHETGTVEIFLLTTTAEGWFPRFGFAQVDRAEVPSAVRESVEFREACPASAMVMRRALR